MEEVQLTGKVKRILFEKNGFAIVMVEVASSSEEQFENKKEVGVKGNMDVMEGGQYVFYGKVVHSEKYGHQLNVTRFEKAKPSSKETIIAFLSGPHFPGVGRATAEEVYRHFGDKTIEVINAHPERLEQLENLSAKRRQTLIDGVKDNYGADNIIATLMDWGFSNRIAFELLRAYRDDTLERVKEHPYSLIFSFHRLTFQEVDHIARNELGFDVNHDERLGVGLLYMLNEECQKTGNTYCDKDDLLHVTEAMFNKIDLIDSEALSQALDYLIEKGHLHAENQKLFLNEMNQAEENIANTIAGLIQNTQTPYERNEVEEVIRQIEEEEDITYGSSQRKALIEAMMSSFYVLTGGPGTGKTTVVKGMIKAYARLHGLKNSALYSEEGKHLIHLAAPTGRAAKRMMEATQLEASTIHRLLGLGIDDDMQESMKDIDEGLLIVDEFSMVDTFLASTLLSAVHSDVHVILVGDKDQLPSVRPGNVLADLLSVNSVPHGELVDIYRQGKDSTIIRLAHAVSQGELIDDFQAKKQDYAFFNATSNNLQKTVENIMTLYAKRGYNAEQMQVLAPKYRGYGGIDNLNIMLQSILNPSAPDRREVKPSPKNDQLVYRVDDKVLYLVNDPAKNVFNGDMGFIRAIVYAKDTHNQDKVDKLVIDFDGNEVELVRNEWSNITLAYCCSIHKSQGSEFPIVLMPMLSEYGKMLKRNLLYTGLTRAKNSLVLLGEEQAFLTAAKEMEETRKTYLAHRLKVKLGEEVDENITDEKEEAPVVEEEVVDYNTFVLTNELALSGTINPMIGMDDVRPESFL